jgi:cation/acetate symporter
VQLARYRELYAAWQAASGPAQEVAWRALDTHAQAIASWFGVRNISAALFGLPFGFLGIWLVSLFTPAPSRAVQEMVERTRTPAGEMIMQEKGATVGS